MRYSGKVLAICCLADLIVSFSHEDPRAEQILESRNRDDRGRFQFHEYDRSSEDPRGLVRQTEYQLDRIIQEMSSFVEGIEFDYFEFDRQTKDIEGKILDLTALVSRARQYKRPLVGRLRFAQNMYRVMCEATDGLNHFLRTKIDQVYVRKLLQLNVALLTIPPTQTLPPTQKQLDVFREKTAEYSEYLSTWKADFSALEDVHDSVSLMFSIQYSTAEHAIRVYQGHLPEKLNTLTGNK